MFIWVDQLKFTKKGFYFYVLITIFLKKGCQRIDSMTNYY